MPFCWRCGTEQSEGSRFCPSCGAAVKPAGQPPVPTPLPAAKPPGWWTRQRNGIKALIVVGVLIVVGGIAAGAAVGASRTSNPATTTLNAVVATTEAPTPTTAGTATTLATATTAQAPTTTLPTTPDGLPAGWITFQGDSISLALPDSFEGGKPTDADVAAMIEQGIALNPSLAGLESIMEAVDIQLLMFGESTSGSGGMPVVLAFRQALPSTVSLELYIETSMAQYSDEQLTIETVEDDRAYFVLRSPAWEGADVMALQHYALRRAGSYLYAVIYTFDDESNTALDSIFRTSADTIVVTE